MLHLEPQRVWPPPTVPPVGGPGRPVDPERARGDLAAVVATALRKDPARRYASVPALIDDLQCWLEHRPVSVRRDNRRHRLRLWLRRHAWLVGTGSTVAGGLLIALGFSIWQWQRAESAARTADRVTQYLSELLISASPDRHGGQWPTVLQVLEQQRKDLLSRFHDDPMTRMRLLQTLSRTYRELNRFDLAVPVAEEWLTLSRQHLGPDHPMTLRAGLDLAHALQILGVADRSVAVARPLVAPVRAAFGPMSDELHRLLYVLESSLLRSGRLDEADRMLAEAGQITDAKTRPGDYDRLSHLNRLQVLRTTQGRLHEALAAINATEPYWGRVQAGDTREWLTFRRNQIAVQIRLSWFDVDIEARGEALMADIARILPRGNDMIAGLRQELARYHSDLGQPLVSLRLRAQALQELQAAGVTDPATLLPRRAQLLMARGQAGEGTPAGLRSEAQALLAEGDAVLPRLGYVRVELWMALARLGLLLDDAPLAAAALQRLRADPAFSPTGHAVWASRIDALEGALARLQDDLPRSRALLLRRLTHLDTYTEPAIHGTWAAVLDLAFTQVLLGDPQAAATLRRAARHRPPSLPADHALDAVTAYLAARLAHGDDNAAPVRQAWSALARRLGRPDMPPPSGRGLLWGALLAFA